MKLGLSTSVMDRGKSGVGQYVLALAREFARTPGPHQFVYFVLEEDLPLFDFARSSSVELVPVPESHRPPVKNLLWHQTTLPSLARAHQLDVLHVPSYRRMVWKAPCASVATIHDLAPFHVPEKYDWRRMFFGRVVARRLARRQDQIIAVSRTTAADIAKHYGLVEPKVSVIHNGVDHIRFGPTPRNIARAVLAQRFDLPDPCFLYVARLEHPAKNHVRLVEAFNRFKAETRLPWKLVLAGSDWHGAEHVHAAVRASRFADDIRVLGFVPDEDLPFLYRGAEVVVCPSLYEGFGIPVLEAMACGRPVVCSKAGALAEVAGDAAVLVDPENVGVLQEQLTRLARDEGLRNELGLAGLKQAGRFTWEATARKTLEVCVRAGHAARQSTVVPALPPLGRRGKLRS